MTYGNYGVMILFICFLVILRIGYVRSLYIGAVRNEVKLSRISMILFSSGFSGSKTYIRAHNCYCLEHKMLDDYRV